LADRIAIEALHSEIKGVSSSQHRPLVAITSLSELIGMATIEE
jgi:hypothetical protein